MLTFSFFYLYGLFIPEALSLFLSLSFPSSCDQHFVLPVITAVQNSAKTDTKKQQNMDEKQNVLCVLMYLLSSRDSQKKSLLLHSLNITQGCLCILSLKDKSKPRRKERTLLSFKHPSE